MTSRDRIKDILNFRLPDRVGITDSFWPETIERWHREGLPADKSPADYFGIEWECIYMDTSFQFEERLLEDYEEYMIRRNTDGMTAKFLKHRSTPPQFLDFVIKTKEDWMEHKSRLTANERRISMTSLYSFLGSYQPPVATWDETLERFELLKQKDKFIAICIYDPYESMWRRCGVEQSLMNMIKDPELVNDMFTTQTDLIINTSELMLSKGIRPDGVLLPGDIAYKNGLLFSPRLYQELLFPCHKKLCDFFHSHKMPVIYHSDGNIQKILPFLVQAGIRAIHPLESKAGMDVRLLKREYGNRLIFMGNIDVTKMSKSRKDIEEEVRSKLELAKKGGGYIYHSDHSVPPDVSLENYKHVLEMVIKYGKY